MFLSKYANKKHGTAARDASIGRLVKVVATATDKTNGYLVIPGAKGCSYPVVTASDGTVRAISKIEASGSDLKITVTSIAAGDVMIVAAY